MVRYVEQLGSPLVIQESHALMNGQSACVYTGNDREASQERIASNGYASTSSIINVQTVESKPFSKPLPAVDIGPTYAGKLTAYCAQSRSSPAVISTLHHP